ncbi:hypothetical protein G3N00_25840, partial|uniref:hypothetical protein n=1 Tax=Escherichia coli TaxID=562 RepID=UPI0013D54E2A
AQGLAAELAFRTGAGPQRYAEYLTLTTGYNTTIEETGLLPGGEKQYEVKYDGKPSGRVYTASELAKEMMATINPTYAQDEMKFNREIFKSKVEDDRKFQHELFLKQYGGEADIIQKRFEAALKAQEVNAGDVTMVSRPQTDGTTRTIITY